MFKKNCAKIFYFHQRKHFFVKYVKTKHSFGPNGKKNHKIYRRVSLSIEWFENKHMKLNADKCHLFISGNKYEHCWVNTGVSKLLESSNVKLLGVNIAPSRHLLQS